MKITKAKIGHFGKLKDIQLDFSEGFNLIYGPNEAGKSTLQAFLKAMLYGMNSSKREIRENDRMRFLPWSGEDASGELYFKDTTDHEYMIKRSFRRQRKKDDATVYDRISGEKIPHIDCNKPGIDLFGIGEEAFEKTLCIQQLHAQVVRDKEDEIMKRLTNLQQTGDENTSYHKASEALKSAKKSLIGQRTPGKLDKLKVRYQELQTEWHKAHQLYQENLEDEIQYKDLTQEQIRIKGELEDLEQQKQWSKLGELKKEYLGLREYESQIQQLSKKIEILEEELKHGNTLVEEELIDFLKDKHTLWLQIIKKQKEIRNTEKRMKEELEILDKMLESYEGYKELDKNIEVELNSLKKEQDSLWEKIESVRSLQREIDGLEEQLQEIRKNLGKLGAFEEVSPSLEREIYEKQERVRELKAQEGGEARRESLLLRRDILHDKVKTMDRIIFLAVFLGLAGFVGAWFKGSYLLALSVMAGCMGVYGWVGRRKQLQPLQKVEEELKSLGDRNQLSQEIFGLCDKLQEIYHRFGVTNDQEWRSFMLQYQQKRSLLETLKIRIEERKTHRELQSVVALEKQLADNQKRIEEILNQCQCRTLGNFFIRLKEYQEILEQQEIHKKEYASCLKEKETLEEELSTIKNEIQRRWVDPYRKIEEIEDLEKEIVDLSNLAKSRRELIFQKHSLEETYRVLLKDRQLHEIEKELERSPANLDKEMSSQESIDTLIQSTNQRWIEIQGELKDRQYSMQKRLQGQRGLVEIEEEIHAVEEQIGYYEEVAASLDIGLEVLEASFKEIQRDFGPRLNQRVGEILGKVTRGKYEDVKISENYEVKVVDPVADQIKEVAYFSNGTWDQIYFALRMGITDLIFEDNAEIPIFLDDAFAQYDDHRLEAGLSYLYEYGMKRQVFLFTCHRREVEFLGKLPGVNVICLDKL